jgi:N-acetylneuraminic acid mutarotase
MVRFRGNPVLLGGRNTTDSGFEVYDSIEEYDVVTDAWSFLEKMKIPRYGHKATTIKEKFIYAFGGYGEDEKEILSIERYNYDERKWTELEVKL